MIVSHSKKFIFIHLEKCGGTSVESALEPYLAWDDLIIGSTDFGEGIQSLYYKRYGIEKVKKDMLWKHSTAKQISEYLGESYSDYKKIVVVRNPVHIVKSLYTFSQTATTLHLGRFRREDWRDMADQGFPNEWPYNEPYIQAYAASQLSGSGIDGFVSTMFRENHSFISPQVNRICAKPLHFDVNFIIDISQLNYYWEDVLGSIGIKDEVPLFKLNKSLHADEVEMSDKTIKIIKNHFAADYEYLPEYTGVLWK